MNLVVELDEASRRAVQALAELPELRGDHVTLAFGVYEAKLEPRWIPGGGRVGDEIELRAVAMCRDANVQCLRVEIGGSNVRPHDGGALHITVSRAAHAHSHQSNELLAIDAGRPISLALRGVVRWRA